MGEHYTHLDIRERAVVEMNLALGKRPAQMCAAPSGPGFDASFKALKLETRAL